MSDSESDSLAPGGHQQDSAESSSDESPQFLTRPMPPATASQEQLFNVRPFLNLS